MPTCTNTRPDGTPCGATATHTYGHHDLCAACHAIHVLAMTARFRQIVRAARGERVWS